MMGTNRISIIKSEEQSKKIMRKSIAATRDIPKGTKITKSMLTLIRPGTGIPLDLIEKIIGTKNKQFIKNGTLLKWEQL